MQRIQTQLREIKAKEKSDLESVKQWEI